MEPRFNEVAGYRPILFVKSRVRYIENRNVTNLRGNEQTFRYIEVIVNDDNPHDTNAVAVKRIQDQGGTLQIVGHVPLTLSPVFHLTVFKTLRTNLSGSDRKKEKQGHWNRISGYVFNELQEAFESEEVNRTNKRQRR